MKLYNNISLSQARKDLQYMKDKYGEPQDFCGSFCNNDVLNDILFGITPLKEAIIDLISYYFSNGIDDAWCGNCSSKIKPDMNDTKTKNIANRYDIDI